MKNITLLTVFFLIVSTSSFGAGFTKRWFWFYSPDENGYVLITYDPENKVQIIL